MQFSQGYVLVFDSGHAKFDTLFTLKNICLLTLTDSAYLLLFFETGSYYVVQAGLELAM